MKKNKKNKLKLNRINIFIIIITFFILFLSTILEFAFIAFLFSVNSPKVISLSVFFVMLFISVVIGFVSNYFLYKVLFGPIIEMTEAMGKIKYGNFNASIKKEKKYPVKEVGLMVERFNDMVWELSNMETFHDDFINNVSHEFKTPISAIEGYASLLQDPNNTVEERKKYSDAIIDSTKRLSKLTGNILAISKLDNQKIKMKENKFLLDEQIRQILLLLEYKWTEKNIQLRINMDETYIVSTEEWLLQVWGNLIDNAIKYSKENGTIDISIVSSNKEVVVRISDDGIGMTEEECQHIFDKFYQADKSHKGEGNGLGMTLVKKIVDAVGGKIEVKSSIGIGSTFTVRLPQRLQFEENSGKIV